MSQGPRPGIQQLPNAEASYDAGSSRPEMSQRIDPTKIVIKGLRFRVQLYFFQKLLKPTSLRYWYLETLCLIGLGLGLRLRELQGFGVSVYVRDKY